MFWDTDFQPIRFVQGENYYAGQIVVFRGVFYRVNVNLPCGIPKNSPEFSLLLSFSSLNVKGPTRPTGPTGATGPTGPQGPAGSDLASTQAVAQLINTTAQTLTAVDQILTFNVQNAFKHSATTSTSKKSDYPNNV